jgi:hypothetical protein
MHTRVPFCAAAAATAAILLVLVPAPRANACQCAVLPSVGGERERAQAVFEVELTGPRPDAAFDARVGRVYKGSPPATITFSRSDCGPVPAAGAWLAYAHERGDRWYFEACGRSRPLASARNDVSQLVRDSTASASAAAPPGPRSSCACETSAGAGAPAVVLVPLAAPLAVRLRRRKSRRHGVHASGRSAAHGTGCTVAFSRGAARDTDEW